MRDYSEQEKVTVYIIVEQETPTSPEDNIIIDTNLERVSEEIIEKEKNTTEQLYTKSGKLRKRKTFQKSLKERQLAKKTKYIEKHAVKEGCKNSCLKKCNIMFSEEDRKYINKYYWGLKWRELSCYT
ncbi:unnamed protein product [Parnassius apollo]|uniref:(apollo) hypothetical protein n=1 Tax=Parnassius apollo TaxID=110799 RepID=A0A8S3XWY9_PARAO|nr:unnamed protein product [Parnassius apollo]